MSFEPAIPAAQKRRSQPYRLPEAEAEAQTPAPGSAPRPRLHITQMDFVWPLVVIGSLTLLMMAMGVHFSVKAFDRENAAREQVLAQQGIAQRIDEVALLAVPQTMWDDAVANMDNRFDYDWTDANIGKYLNHTEGFDSSYVLRGDGRIAYAAIDGRAVAASRYAAIADKAAPLVRAVRAVEAQRGPLKPLASDGMIAKPIQASALDMVDGQMAVLTATLIQPDFGTAIPSTTGAPVVVTTMTMDAPFLDLFARRFQLQGLHVRRLNEPRVPGETGVAMQDDRGRHIADLAWRPLDPGYQMLRHFLPPIGAVCLALSAIALLLLRRVQRTAATLIDAEAHARELGYHDRLSSLPNEACFIDALAERIGAAGMGRPVAVHMIEIDLLRTVRSDYAPERADTIVHAACFAMAGQCSRDSFVARLSDARFGIVSAGMDEEQATGFAARLQTALPVLVDEDQRLSLDRRVSFTVIRDPATTALEALSRAGHALYRAIRAY